MDDFVSEDGDLFMDPGACDSPDLGADLERDRAPPPAQGGHYGSASLPRKRLLIKSRAVVRHEDTREDLDERPARLELEDGGVDSETGGGPRKRRRSSGLSDQAARGWDPEKHKEKRRKEGSRLRREEGGPSSGGKGFDVRDEDQGERGKEVTATAYSAEEHDAVDRLFEGAPAQVGLIIEEFMAVFELAYEDDANLCKESKRGRKKLDKLPLLIKVLSKKYLQKDFLDHGILTLLKKWLEPLPDKIMPSLDIRAAVLKILNDMPIDLEQLKRRQQLKNSGLPKVIMFLSRSSEETAANRKLANELIDKWGRAAENTRSEDRPLQMMRRKSVQGGFRPEPSRLDFVVRPKPNVDPEEIRGEAKQVVRVQHNQKVSKRPQVPISAKKKLFEV